MQTFKEWGKVGVFSGAQQFIRQPYNAVMDWQNGKIWLPTGQLLDSK